MAPPPLPATLRVILSVGNAGVPHGGQRGTGHRPFPTLRRSCGPLTAAPRRTGWHATCCGGVYAGAGLLGAAHRVTGPGSRGAGHGPDYRGVVGQREPVVDPASGAGAFARVAGQLVLPAALVGRAWGRAPVAGVQTAQVHLPCTAGGCHGRRQSQWDLPSGSSAPAPTRVRWWEAAARRGGARFHAQGRRCG